MRLKAKVVLEFDYEPDMEKWTGFHEVAMLTGEAEEFREHPRDMFRAWTEHDGKISVEVVPMKRKRG